jgi:hypothetical protein
LGSVQITENKVSNRFDPSGTAFAYVGELQNGMQPVTIVITWLAIDPRRPIGDFDSKRIEAMKTELKTRDTIVIRFDNISDIKLGRFEPNRFFASRIYFSSNETVASIHDLDLNLNTVELASNGVLSGSAVLNVRKTSTDPANAKTGVIKFRFDAPMVPGTNAKDWVTALGL